MNLASISVKVLAASLLLAATSGSAFAAYSNYKGEVAEPCPPPPMLHDGFYVGGQVGYDSYRFRNSVDVAVTTGGLTIATAEASSSLSARGWTGGLFVGYGRYLTDVFYLGGELFGNFSGAKGGFDFTNSAGSLLDIDVKARGNWGLSLLPGVRLNNATTLYGRVGYTWGRFRAHEHRIIDVDVDGTPDLDVSRSDSGRKGGWHWGLGLETLLCDNWSLRADYTYTRYNSFSGNFVSDPILTLPGTPVVSVHGTSKPSNNAFNLGIIYHFA